MGRIVHGDEGEDRVMKRNVSPVREERKRRVESPLPEKLPYSTPRITTHRPLVKIALGGTPGIGDSGNGSTHRPPQ